jgi:hypothetical protein
MTLLLRLILSGSDKDDQWLVTIPYEGKEGASIYLEPQKGKSKRVDLLRLSDQL